MQPIQVGADFANYRIIRHIGGGGMAQIYLAKTKGLAGFEKHLALKVINTEYANEERFVQMLINEAKIAVSLSHVNIAQIFDLGEYEGTFYMAMEYVDGLDVLELVNGLHAMEEQVPLEAVAYVGRQICSGLHYAHTRRAKDGRPLGVVHRDVSPQNIIVSRAGEVKVVDFGVAKAVGLSSKTQAGVIKGKVNYMAPEQLKGQPADARSDVFAVGIVLWEMITSQMVYTGDNVSDLATKVRKAEISAPSSVRSDIPPELDELVMRALRRNARERLQTAHQFQVALTKFLAVTAPEYSGSHLATLVERVYNRDRGTELTPETPDLLSERDRLHDRHSLIFKPSGQAQLVLRLDEGDEVYPIQSDVVLGRAGDITLADARVSRRHARVRQAGIQYIVEDLGSSNGTYVNGERLDRPYPLHHNDEIRVGNSMLVFQTSHDFADLLARASGARPQMPRLVVDSGGKQVEREIDNEMPLDYRLTVGSLELRGCAGRVVRRDDGLWLEPDTLRSSVVLNGQVATHASRLSAGDHFEVDGVTFTLKE